MSRGILMFALATCILCAEVYAQPQCRIQISMENTLRKVLGEVHKECGWEPEGWHSPPWGAWGVESSFASRSGSGTQFEGFHLTGGSYQWNSCTKDDWEAPNCGAYNYNSCTQQQTVTGVNYWGSAYIYYGVGCEEYNEGTGEWEGGCQDKDGRNLGPSNSNMGLWEMDTGCCDDYVTTLTFNNFNVRAQADCPDPSGCDPSTGSWVASNSNSIASTDIRVQILDGVFIEDPDYCDPE